MTVQRTFFNWSTSGLDPRRPPFDGGLSPNVRVLSNLLIDVWGGQRLGEQAVIRPIRGGEALSAHAFGVLDWRYQPGWLPGTTARTVPRTTVTDTIIPWLVDWSNELKIDAIHDYLGDRIWRAGRTSNVADAHAAWWKPQNGQGGGMGESWAGWLHIEPTRDGWGDARPITARGIPIPGGGATPTPPPGPTKTKQEVVPMIIAAKQVNAGPWFVSIDGGQSRLHVAGPKADLFAAAGMIDAGTARKVAGWAQVTTLPVDTINELLGPLA